MPHQIGKFDDMIRLNQCCRCVVREKY